MSATHETPGRPFDVTPVDPTAQERLAAKKRGYGLPPWMSVVTAFRIAAVIPDWAWRPVIRFAGWLAVTRNYRAQRQWRLNASVMMGRPVTDAEARAGVRSWLRNLAGSVRLGRYSRTQVMKMVQVDAESEALLRSALAHTGAVVALPHMGDYDLAGAYFCAKGMPVSAVGERLPDQEFEYFMTIRQAVGMTVYPHGEPAVLDKLADDLGRGHVVALVSDRDLSRHSVPVVWHTPSGDHRVTMPPGPALLAQRTGADLLAAVCTFEGRRIRIRTFGPLAVTPGDDGLAVTSQRLADVFCREVAANVPQWHVMQRFFPGVVAT